MKHVNINCVIKEDTGEFTLVSVDTTVADSETSKRLASHEEVNEQFTNISLLFDRLQQKVNGVVTNTLA